MEIKDTKKMSVGLMNKINKRQVLAVIRKESHISRSEIVKKLGLTAPTVNRILNQLAETGFVEFMGAGKSGGGRPPMIVKFNGRNNFVIGIDVGATTIRAVLSNFDAEFISEINVATKISEGEEAILQQIASLVKKLLGEKNVDQTRILGIGIGVPGLVDKKNGTLSFSSNFGWKNFEFEKRLAEKIDLPILFDNSTRLMALGEMKYGKGALLHDYLLVNVGYGIAAGVVVNGKLVTGALGHAGEFGHIVIDPESEVICECGGKGHLQALAAGHHIEELGRQVVKNDPKHKLAASCGGDSAKVNAKMVANLAAEGNKECYEIFDRAIRYLSIGIVNLVNLFDPQIIFIGGGIALNGQFFFNKVNKYVNDLKMNSKEIQIEPATFGENGSIVGACSLVMEAVLNFEIPMKQLSV